MNSTRAFAVVALGLVAVLPACDDTTAPPPPPPPPQILTKTTYTYSSTGLTHNDVFAFLAVSNGEFWIGGAAGIAKFPNLDTTSRSGVVTELTGLPNSKVRAMAEYSGKVYVATWGGGVGVYDVAAGTWSKIQKKTNGLRDNSVADVVVSAVEDRVYFATNDGVSIYNPTAQTFTSVTTAQGLLDKLVSCIEVVDLIGTIERWYGPRVDLRLYPVDLPDHGITVSRTPGSIYNLTTDNSGIAEPNVNDIFWDADRQTFWVAYEAKGISEVNPAQKTWTTDTTVQGLPSNTVYSVTKASGYTWAATQNGLAKRVGERDWQGYNRSGGLQADRVREVYSPDGNRLYLGFVDGGAARMAD